MSAGEATGGPQAPGGTPGGTPGGNPAGTPAGGIRVRVLGADDRPAQARLYDRCFAKSDGARVVPWRYDANPHGAAVTLGAQTPEGELVAGYACSPRVVLHHGRELLEPGGEADGPRVGQRVGQTGDVMTDPDLRRTGIFSRLDREAMARTAELGWPVVFGLPNQASAHIFVDQLGWRSVGHIRPWTFVLHADAASRAERLRAGRLAAAAVPWAYLSGARRRGKLRERAFDAVSVVPLPRFDSEVDALARSVAEAWPWMVRRDAAYLNWRFVDAPSGRFVAQGAYEAGGELVGYCVVQLPAAGESVGHVVDVLGADEVAQAGALEAALGHLHKAGASLARAHAIAGSAWERTLRAAGFRPPKRRDQKPVIAHLNHPDHPLARAALAPERWFFTDGDRDDELIR